jgi:hypothetical protein
MKWTLDPKIASAIIKMVLDGTISRSTAKVLLDVYISVAMVKNGLASAIQYDDVIWRPPSEEKVC